MWVGKCLFAQTCPHPHTFPLLQHELELAVATQLERIKLAKYAHLNNCSYTGIVFQATSLCPLLLRHLECWERQLRIFWESWVDDSAWPQENPSVKNNCLQHIPIAMQRGNAQLQSLAPRESHSYRAGSDCLQVVTLLLLFSLTYHCIMTQHESTHLVQTHHAMQCEVSIQQTYLTSTI